jgi:cytochrome P450
MDLTYFYAGALLATVYLIYLIFYRLYLSPISHIPGPKLAAVTFWYEYYYDVVNYGQYIFKIRDLHKQYGNIVRINPYEIHVADPDFYDTLYAATNNNRKDRWGWYTFGVGLPLSLLGTVEQGLHRKRRAAMSPYFSKQTVRRLEPLIVEDAAKLASRFEKLASTGEVIVINHAFSAFTNGTRTSQL